MLIIRVLTASAVAALSLAAPALAADRPDFDARGASAAAADRTLAAPSGALTGPSGAAPADIAHSFLSRERASLGLDAADVRGLELARTVPLGHDGTSLLFASEQDGVPLFGADVRVAIGDDGRVLSVTGAPAHAADAATLTPTLSAADAVAAARTDAGLPAGAVTGREVGGARRETRFDGGTTARLVRFPWGDTSVIAWRVLLQDDGAGVLSDYVVDGSWGKVLHRHSLVDSAATGFTFPSWPGAAVGGTQTDEDFSSWVDDGTKLQGNNTHVWTDIDASESAAPSEEVPATSGTDWHYPLMPVDSPGHACIAGFGCTWDSRVPNSWETNREADATQLFSVVNRMHDWLLQPAIGFTEAAGNFQTVNFSGQGKGADPVRAMASYGANTDGGLPASRYLSNANMGTPPDGESPSMRMFLWSSEDDRLDVLGSVDPVIVLHEYTHGLSNRLVIDADGISTLTGGQSAAMGEAWSDWYAYDYVVAHGYETDDTAVPGSLADSPLQPLGRTQPMDCPVGASSPRCPGSPEAGPGGYTYGDYGQVIGFPEVHADGEIWAETLWDLRRRLEADLGAGSGVARARSLVTRAMQLSVPYPTFLDMRNAILRADTSFFGGEDVEAIWEVFAARGMGFFATTTGSADAAPIEDFSVPPSATGTLAGRVSSGGRPAAGVPVSVDGGPSTVTGEDGRYSLELPAGTYARVTFGPGNGIDVLTKSSVDVPAGGTRTLDASPRTDWLASSGGATIASVSPNDFRAQGAGPPQAVDQRPNTAWGGYGPETPGHEGPKQITIQLVRPVDLSEVTIDPTPDPRTPASWMIADYRVETSTDGVAFTRAGGGTFTADDVGAPQPVALDAGTGAVRFVRLVILSTQGPFSSNRGSFAVAEISAYGTPWVAPLPQPGGGGGSVPAPAPTPEPPAPPTTPPALTPAPIAPVTPVARRGSVRVTRTTDLGQVRRRGLPLRLSCATACRARVVVRLPFAHGMVAGVMQRDLAAGRPVSLRVKLRHGAVRRLAGRRSARAQVVVRLAGRDGGPARTLRRTVRLT